MTIRFFNVKADGFGDFFSKIGWALVVSFVFFLMLRILFWIVGFACSEMGDSPYCEFIKPLRYIGVAVAALFCWALKGNLVLLAYMCIAYHLLTTYRPMPLLYLLLWTVLATLSFIAFIAMASIVHTLFSEARRKKKERRKIKEERRKIEEERRNDARRANEVELRMEAEKRRKEAEERCKEEEKRRKEEEKLAENEGKYDLCRNKAFAAIEEAEAFMENALDSMAAQLKASRCHQGE